MQSDTNHSDSDRASKATGSQQTATSIGSDRLARRTFLRRVGLGALALGPGAALLNSAAKAGTGDDEPTQGDIAILRFLAAAEIIESDLWTQYTELGGLNNSNPPNNYQVALSNLDGDASQYITSNTIDELSHASFLNAYLQSKGAEPVNLDQFRTLQGSRATVAQNIGRLTNLMQLNVDTSWYVRYRSATNPDFGATFPQALHLQNVTAIPRNDNDFNGAPNPNFPGNNHIQAIANVAAFHFGYIEQGGSSLYAALSQKVTSLEVLKIVFGIGGDEVAHFLEWVDLAGNSVQAPIAPFKDSKSGLKFPDFFANPPLSPPNLVQPNLIFPVPCEFISASLPHCAVIRPGDDKFGGAVATIASFTQDGLFIGQSSQFLQTVNQLAQDADAATRQV